MEKIVYVIGKVKFPITLDPSVWIFDDRKLDLDTYFDQRLEKVNELDEYTKSISKHWDREIIEGATAPSPVKTEKKYKKEIVLTTSFGILFQPFLDNAEPLEEAQTVVIESVDTEHSLPIEEAKKMILGFSQTGKPLSEDGPVHVYFGDGSNRKNPIKNIRAFRVE